MFLQDLDSQEREARLEMHSTANLLVASSADVMMEVGAHAGLFSGGGVEERDRHRPEDHTSKSNMLFY